VKTPAPGAKTVDILVSTTRARDSRPGTFFSGERAEALDYAAFRVSIPPTHVPGQVQFPNSPPGNPETDFVVRSADYLDGDAEFKARLRAEIRERPKGQRKIVLFIHGYNTLFSEALYVLAQVAHDSPKDPIPVLFTWASRGELVDYVYDNNSATISRDDLEKTARMLFESEAEEINVLAHSMGNWVTVETLRQVKISGKIPPIDKLGAIVLASPDIDVDVFKSQMRRFGKPRRPFIILVSKDDRALELSSLLAGGQKRLGADTEDAEQFAEFGAIIVDLSDLKSNDPINHGKFMELAQVAPHLRAIAHDNAHAPRRAARESGNVVTAVETILTAPVRLIFGR
jgi:esterase/lipase superfamily enzyme